MTDYFVIQYGEGSTHVEKYTYNDLIKSLDEKWFGEYPNFLKELPDNTDTRDWNNGILIIAGSVAVPEARDIISKYVLTA